MDRLLARFPPRTHPLTLVSDPDELLDAEMRSALGERGFGVVAEPDPVALRHAIEQARPFTAAAPLIIITTGPLNALPYDLWQQGVRLELSLSDLFPNLAYDALSELSPAQRRRLDAAQEGQPTSPLGYAESVSWLLLTLFDAAPSQLRTPAQLIGWVDRHHAAGEALPAAFATTLVAALHRIPAFANWPLASLIADHDAFRSWLRQGHALTQDHAVREPAVVTYAASALPAFAADRDLQALVPLLVRSGALAEVQPTPKRRLRRRAYRADGVTNDNSESVKFSDELATLASALAGDVPRWEQWQNIAQRWARLTLQAYDLTVPIETAQMDQYSIARSTLDASFQRWITDNYAALAGRRLPTPHHLFHIPGWLAHRVEQRDDFRPALIVMDGMALADWQRIRDAWQERHPDWAFDEQLVLAQLPSITAISRQALISGRRPADFADTVLHNRQEAQLWASFWERVGLPTAACAYEVLPTRQSRTLPQSITSRRTRAICLVCPDLDQLIHDEAQGTPGFLSALGVWLGGDSARRQRSSWIEEGIEQLLAHGFSVFLTSDHGHTEARGIGQPKERATVETRSKRALVYRTATLAATVQQNYSETILWSDDGLLPDNVHAVLTEGRVAFAPTDTKVVSHGGMTIDELAVPLVAIAKQ